MTIKLLVFLHVELSEEAVLNKFLLTEVFKRFSHRRLLSSGPKLNNYLQNLAADS